MKSVLACNYPALDRKDYQVLHNQSKMQQCIGVLQVDKLVQLHQDARRKLLVSRVLSLGGNQLIMCRTLSSERVDASLISAVRLISKQGLLSYGYTY